MKSLKECWSNVVSMQMEITEKRIPDKSITGGQKDECRV